jgi:acyl carrier protein
VNSQIMQVLREVRPESDFDNSSDFLSDGLIDSFDMMVLVVCLERTFEIKIPGTEITPVNFKSIDSIAHLISNLTA